MYAQKVARDVTVLDVYSPSMRVFDVPSDTDVSRSGPPMLDSGCPETVVFGGVTPL